MTNNESCSSDVPKLKTNIMEEITETVGDYKICALRCAERRFCVAINYNNKVEAGEVNCQLTNTTEPKFEEIAAEEKTAWTFRKISLDRSQLVKFYYKLTYFQGGWFGFNRWVYSGCPKLPNVGLILI